MTTKTKTGFRFRAVERVERELRKQNMTVIELSNALFVSTDTARYALDELMRHGKVKREVHKDGRECRPAYRYSLIAPSTQEARGEVARELVGSWDAL